MPIYEYRCADCGFQKDILQKISDTPVTTCPTCGHESFSKALTAAGFQLKGSGWYATDFKGGSGNTPNTPSETKPADTSSSDSTKPASCGGSCACH